MAFAEPEPLIKTCRDCGEPCADWRDEGVLCPNCVREAREGLGLHERYRREANARAKAFGGVVTLTGSVDVVNPRGRNDAGEGAFVEVKVWIPASAVLPASSQGDGCGL